MRSRLCYHKPMQKPTTEPSVLQIFRLYAWVQLVSIFLLPLVDMLVMRFHPQPPRGVVLMLQMSVNQTLPIIFLILASLGLLIYLYSHWLQKHLPGFYIPAALVFATLLLTHRTASLFIFHARLPGRCLPSCLSCSSW